MKKILIPTDFSPPAENAARYAISLAAIGKASVLICHAISVPSEAPMASRVAWPLMDYATLKQQSDSELDLLIRNLEDSVVFAVGNYKSIGRSLELGAYGLRDWAWLQVTGLLIVVLSLLIIENPLFASINIVVWTATALIVSGVFRILLLP